MVKLLVKVIYLTDDLVEVKLSLNEVLLILIEILALGLILVL